MTNKTILSPVYATTRQQNFALDIYHKTTYLNNYIDCDVIHEAKTNLRNGLDGAIRISELLELVEYVVTAVKFRCKLIEGNPYNDRWAQEIVDLQKELIKDSEPSLLMAIENRDIEAIDDWNERAAAGEIMRII